MFRKLYAHLTFRIALWTVSPLFALILLVWGVFMIATTPTNLTSIVNKYASRYLNADVRFEKVEMSIFRDFPNVNVNLHRGAIVSKVLDREADTLMRFDDFRMALNMRRLLSSEIKLEGVSLLNPDIYCYVDSSGRANWEIYTGSDTAATAATAAAAAPVIDYGLNLDRLEITGGRVRYESLAESIYGDVELSGLYISGMAANDYNLDIDAVATLRADTLTLAADLPLKIEGGVKFDLRKIREYTLRELAITVGDIPVTLDGDLSIDDESIYSYLTCTVSPASAATLLGLIPAQLVPEASKVTTDIKLDMHAGIRGYYRFETGTLPSLTLDVKVDGGSLNYEGVSAGIKDLKVDALLNYDPQNPSSTGVVLRDMEFDGAGVKIDAHGEVWNLMGDPSIDACVNGYFDFNTVASQLPIPVGVLLRGQVKFDIDLLGRLSQLDVNNLGNAYIDTKVWMDNFVFDSPKDTIRFFADRSEFTIGLNANSKIRDTLMDERTQVLYLTAVADSATLDYKDQFRMLFSGANLWARNAASALTRDRSRVHPFHGAGDLGYYEFIAIDSTRVTIEDAYTSFSILPSPADAATPVLNLSVGAMGIGVHTQYNFCQLNGADLNMEAELARPSGESLARRQRALDSLQVMFPDVARDSLFRHMMANRKFVTVKDDFVQNDIDMTAPMNFSALLYKWNAKGSVYAISADLVTPYFPVDSRISDVDIAFTTNDVTLRGTRIRAGRSDARLTGSFSNLRRVLMGRGNLEANLNITSDTLHFNELVRTLNAGMDFLNSWSYIDELNAAGSREELQQLIADNQNVDEASSLLVIPSNIDADLNLDVHHGIYGTLVLTSLTGNCLMRDRCLQLNNLQAVTDAGQMTMNAIYATRGREDITVGFDLDVKEVDVAKFIAAIPMVDSLFPMMRSFEGKLDCEVAATARLDTVMNVLLPTLNAACRLHGEELVLLDGETFTEISRRLKFKNRQRNLIDEISVEVLIRDSQVELFPFIMQMDRYKAAISGTHKLDMTFNYHISILKSPIPIRFGLNISGSLDKMKFRIGSAKYKNERLPSYVELIDSTRLNLREAIVNIFHKGIDAAAVGEMRITPDLPPPAVATDDWQDGELSEEESRLLVEEGIIAEGEENAAIVPGVEKSGTKRVSRRDRKNAANADM